MKNIEKSEGYGLISRWMEAKGNTPFSFQRRTWLALSKGYSGMVVAPTGFGKTYSVFLGLLVDFMNHPDRYEKGLKLIWITPLRSLAKDLARAMQEVIDEIGLDWVVGVRNGDTDPKVRKQQLKQVPEILLLTPESLHLLIAQKDHQRVFKSLTLVAVDEWHELLGSKRGVMVELALGYLVSLRPKLQVWGISATIGNLDQAMEVLLASVHTKTMQIVAREKKKISIQSVYPSEVEVLPWAGHLGGKLAEKVVPIILKSKSTLIFTNTRSQSEMWYQLLLDAHPDFAGQIALHHGSIDRQLREWIEEALSDGRLKAVVATSSLDLGVDFKPVDTVIQIGSSKGVARFLQRAGRSGHSPFETAVIYFVPTHSLELIEVAALKAAVRAEVVESRDPLVMSVDVLIQFLVTLALGGGFYPNPTYDWIKKVYSFEELTESDWAWCMLFITVGGALGKNYEEFHRVVRQDDGLMRVQKRRIGMLHRMNLGSIVSDAMLRVKFLSGGYIGMVEEYFITKLKKGDRFILAGRVLAFEFVREMTVFVSNSSGPAITPSWLGGRLPLSANLSHFLRLKLAESQQMMVSGDKELNFLRPLFDEQQLSSFIPREDQFLIERIKTREGTHFFFYPIEGRLVHEVMASLLAYRISRLMPVSFSMAMNDFGFELFTDLDVQLSQEQLQGILSTENLMQDVLSSINATEMASRKFRDIAVIAGLVVQNFPGVQKNNKSLQASASIIFKVLEEHDPHNLLLRQAYMEVFNQQLEEPRLRAAFERIAKSTLIYRESDRFTPLSFPIKVDSLRQSLSSEDLTKRIERMQSQTRNRNRRRKP